MVKNIAINSNNKLFLLPVTLALNNFMLLLTMALYDIQCVHACC
jgi:hypothetical protein